MKPCKAVINISAIVYELEPTGETGRSIGPIPLREAGIRNRLITLSGSSQDECLNKLKIVMDELNNAGATV